MVGRNRATLDGGVARASASRNAAAATTGTSSSRALVSLLGPAAVPARTRVVVREMDEATMPLLRSMRA